MSQPLDAQRPIPAYLREECACGRGKVAVDQTRCIRCVNESFAEYGERFRRAIENLPTS